MASIRLIAKRKNRFNCSAVLSIFVLQPSKLCFKTRTFEHPVFYRRHHHYIIQSAIRPENSKKKKNKIIIVNCNWTVRPSSERSYTEFLSPIVLFFSIQKKKKKKYETPTVKIPVKFQRGRVIIRIFNWICRPVSILVPVFGYIN